MHFGIYSDASAQDADLEIEAPDLDAAKKAAQSFATLLAAPITLQGLRGDGRNLADSTREKFDFQPEGQGGQVDAPEGILWLK